MLRMNFAVARPTLSPKTARSLISQKKTPKDVLTSEKSEGVLKDFHITPWEKETHLQNCLGKGHVSSQEGILLETNELHLKMDGF